jgi:hypothetical protein
VKEEAKLRELELETRRVAIAEEELKLKALTARSALATRAKAEVLEATAEGADAAGGEKREMGSGGEVKQLAGPSENERRLLELMKEVSGVLNRGGSADERLLEARGVLAEGVKGIGT